MNPIALLQKSVLTRIVAAIVALIALLSAGYILLEIGNSRTAAKQAIAAYGMRLAESYAQQFDTQPYEAFLQKPEENDGYWAIRGQLDQYRTQIGALYVYLVRFGDQDQPIIMIDGQPKGSDAASPIGEVTDMPAAAIADVKEGRTAATKLLDNPEYGSYLSAFAPIRSKDGAVIGALGVDTDARVIASISGAVIRGSLGFYALLLAASAAALAAIVFLIVRSLRPLRLIQSGAELIAAGELAQAERLLADHPVRSADEIGATYRAMTKMSGSLRSSMGALVAGIAGASEQTAASSSRFRDEADRLLASNETVQGAMQEVAEGAQTQRIGAADSARAIGEMTQGIVRISEAAQAVADAAQAALGEAEEGAETMRRLERQVRAVSATGGDVLAMARTLNDSSALIGGALDMIAGIASQTKLLALNASIEAARAGEHGRGFAVVAGEVRQLAEASAQAASQIGALLQDIRLSATGIGGKMTTGVQEMTQGVAIAASAEVSFRNMLDKFKQVGGQMEEVSAAAEQMSAGSEEVAAAVANIADIAQSASEQIFRIYEMTQQQSEAARHIAESAAQVSVASQEMRRSVERLKV
ncbi:methyl-accepting chemotaxis protein [Paenibacillus cymbidii]|uniref:methyl-accepting chemotaxis protein n=1 Tax=Paenibacillus cymbidii TaxID=1639034 RepID=UPI001081AD73|nr:methyl-accepting chemotaxis protein [Paenibacillus cymbidii]